MPTQITGDKPAYPVNYVKSDNGSIYNSSDDELGGMSIRTVIAMNAMQGILASMVSDGNKYTVNGGYLHYESVAKDALGCADALLEQLNKTN